MAEAAYEPILAPLDQLPLLVRRPLSAAELVSLESKVGITMPAGVRAWLGTVGFFQDATHGADLDFQLLENEQEVVDARRHILELIPDAGSDLFPFGDDGAGDPVAVQATSDGDRLVLVDHETCKTSVIGPLAAWQKQVVDHAVARSASTTGQMRWGVQFAFDAVTSDGIFDALRTVAIVQLQGNWSARTKTPSGGMESTLSFRLNGRPLTMERLECQSSPTLLFTFDYEEPASLPKEQSFIAKLDALFSSRPELGYKLVDYGPLDMSATGDDEKDDADEDAASPVRLWFRRLAYMFRM